MIFAAEPRTQEAPAMLRSIWFLIATLLASPGLWAISAAEAVEAFNRDSEFLDVQLSPDGRHLAATIPGENSTPLGVFLRDGLKSVAAFNLDDDSHVVEFWWISDTRIVLSVGEKWGRLERAYETGELYLLDVETGQARILAGPRITQRVASASGLMHSRSRDATYFIRAISDRGDVILVASNEWSGEDESATRIDRLEIATGKRTEVSRVPLPSAGLLVDREGQLRMAYAMKEGRLRTFRLEPSGDWALLNDEAANGEQVWPYGLLPDGRVLLRVRRDAGPDRLEALDKESSRRSVLFVDPIADPYEPIIDAASGAVIGVVYMEGLPRSHYFEPDAAPSRLQRSLEASFAGQRVFLRSATRDGRLQLLTVHSDTNPGDDYLLDVASGEATHLASRRTWIDPDAMRPMQPFRFDARDGLALYGYVTRPEGEGPAPTVLLVHGGPFGVRDDWGFNDEVQLLASQGYAVLQVNFRGSAGFGRGFEKRGYRQWGAAMQDDLVDAVRWAVAQGIADQNRVCIYGSSYGAYAALMGVARDAGLFSCAVGNVGVYDLRMMYNDGDIQASRVGHNFLEETLGIDDLDERSPTRLAERINVPVLLAAGEADVRAPRRQTRAMQVALRRADVPVEAHYYDGEGHGLANPANRRDYYMRLLTFLATHLKPGN